MNRLSTMARFAEPDEHKAVTVCARERCGEQLYKGQEVYKYDDDYVCPDCLVDYLLDQKVIECIDL